MEKKEVKRWTGKKHMQRARGNDVRANTHLAVFFRSQIKTNDNLRRESTTRRWFNFATYSRELHQRAKLKERGIGTDRRQRMVRILVAEESMIGNYTSMWSNSGILLRGTRTGKYNRVKKRLKQTLSLFTPFDSTPTTTFVISWYQENWRISLRTTGEISLRGRILILFGYSLETSQFGIT